MGRFIAARPFAKEVSNMNRHRIVMTVLAMVLATSASAATQTSVGVGVILGAAPPPPVIVVQQQPNLLMVPGTTVYVVNDHRVGYDWFRVGGYWYIYNRGYWYRAHRYRGPFVAIHSKLLPAAIIRVPAKHWKKGHPHGGPPGQMKKGAYRSDAVVVRNEGKGKGKH
jgi:hypothetical protein